MIDPADVPPVAPAETLARYILHRGHLRPSDGCIKQDAFVPHPYTELSVTRHLQATESDLWNLGHAVSRAQSKTLYGRGDFQAALCEELTLQVEADPIEGNPNHANVTGWPTDKPNQKTRAQKIAAAAQFIPLASPPTM